MPSSPSIAVPHAGRAAAGRAHAAFAAAALLVALGVAWELWLAPTGRGTLAVKVLPLAACLPGLLRGRLRTFRVVALLVWLYVTEGLVRVSTERGIAQGLAALELVLCALLFVAVVAFVRHAHAAPAPEPPA